MRFQSNGIVLTLFLASYASSLDAQNPSALRIERDRLLPFSMRVKTIGPFRSSGARQPSGLIWAREVPTPGSETGSSVRLHVRLIRTPSQGWDIRIKTPTGQEVERIRHDSHLVKAGEFWTDEVVSPNALIELWTDAGVDPADLEIEVDQYAYARDPSVAQAITGRDQRVPIGEAPPRLRTWAGPIARLRFIVDGQGGAVCSGFLVSRDLLMTNEHCISSGSEARSAVAEFRYDSHAALPTRYRGMALVVSNAALDYALLRLRGNPSQHGRVLFAASGPQLEGRSLAIIQHPAGEPKQASVADCKVSGLNRTGVGGTNTDFGHLCDTLGGSSGSPVFDWSSLRVVGLHHLGFREGIDEPVNQAVRMQLIRAHVRQEKPNIAVEIWGTGP